MREASGFCFTENRSCCFWHCVLGGENPILLMVVFPLEFLTTVCIDIGIYPPNFIFSLSKNLFWINLLYISILTIPINPNVVSLIHSWFIWTVLLLARYYSRCLCESEAKENTGKCILGFYDNAKLFIGNWGNSYYNDISRSRSINQNIYLEYKLGFVHLKNLNYLN